MSHVADSSTPKRKLLGTHGLVCKSRCLSASLGYNNIGSGIVNKPKEPKKLTQSPRSCTEALVAPAFGSLFPQVPINRHWRMACSRYARSNQILAQNAVIFRLLATVNQESNTLHRF